MKNKSILGFHKQLALWNHTLLSRKGFALISSLMIMMLLMLVALAMLSLSSTSARSATVGKGISEAKANARMALMFAIGELQETAGADMRITANADILDAANPPLLGVWKSWEGSNQEQSGDLRGRPTAPDYASKLKNVSNDGRFLNWLVSGAEDSSATGDAANLVSMTASADSVPLVSSGSIALGDTRQVHVMPNKIGDDGAMAWWISGENQKARIPKPYDESVPPTSAEWSDRNRSHAVADTEPFSLDRILADPELGNKAVSRGSADIIVNDSDLTNSFHDLSASSMGLLTNVATGGWRKDFSLLTEKWDEQPISGLEFYKISPTESLKYTRPATNVDYQPSNSMLYHWADYRGGTLREFMSRRGSIASWAKIQKYATLYKEMSATSSRAPNIDHRSWADNGTPENAHETFHNIRLLPQMARLQLIVSHYATTNGAAPGKYRPAVLYTPVVTVWNPYNTRLTFNGRLAFSASYTWPLALNHKLSGASLADEYWAVQAGGTSGDYRTKCLSKSTHWFQDMRYTLSEASMILEPGETRIFSPSEGYLSDKTTTNNAQVTLSPGVRTGVGFFYTMDRRLEPEPDPVLGYDPQKISLAGGTSIEADAKFDVASRGTACGWAYQWFIGSIGSGRSHSWFQIFYENAVADALYPPKEGLASATLEQCADTPVPFLSMTLGSRIANHRATATKGLVQANPVVDFFSSGPRPRFTDVYPGMDNLLNCPWDFSIVEHSSGGDDMLPNVDNDTNSSYIVTGVSKAEGVSRIVAAELPTRPLGSLADLSQMQIRGLNPTPPYATNIIANSDASPLIPKNNIVNASGNGRANRRDNEQQDDSYCANQVLFDDWFFSSIAPEPDGFGSSSGSTLTENFTEFLRGTDPLTNRAYFPIHEDQVTTSTEANGIYTTEVAPADSWKTIASRLEVEGMFNVNSTSVTAWRALLGHARNQKIPHLNAAGDGVVLSEPTDYAFPRSGVAGDEKAGAVRPGEYAFTTEFTGYRVFDEATLDLLAEEVVKQVRLRGPFLSLSEFVNRQLTAATSDQELALTGAIQAALNALAENSSLNPFEDLQNESNASVANPLGDPEYSFPEAAVGHSSYGLPGWTRQADILRPLAPVLSARDDTFTIRAYGESVGVDGTVKARAWCEATVSRTKNFVDTNDKADITGEPQIAANKTFGRRFEIISFRWLNQNEV